MFAFRPLLLLLTFIPTLCLAAPRWYEKYTMFPRVVVPQSYYEVLNLRAQTPINPHAAVDITCLDPKAHIISHDESAASLNICGGFAGSPGKTRCGGSPAETAGRSGTALFRLRAVDEGQAINMSKDRWLQCVRAAREACPTGSVSGTCLGGATRGNVAFTLTGV